MLRLYPEMANMNAIMKVWPALRVAVARKDKAPGSEELVEPTGHWVGGDPEAVAKPADQADESGSEDV
jgi:hypothetical protein